MSNPEAYGLRFGETARLTSEQLQELKGQLLRERRLTGQDVVARKLRTAHSLLLLFVDLLQEVDLRHPGGLRTLPWRFDEPPQTGERVLAWLADESRPEILGWLPSAPDYRSWLDLLGNPYPRTAIQAWLPITPPATRRRDDNDNRGQ